MFARPRQAPPAGRSVWVGRKKQDFKFAPVCVSAEEASLNHFGFVQDKDVAGTEALANLAEFEIPFFTGGTIVNQQRRLIPRANWKAGDKAFRQGKIKIAQLDHPQAYVIRWESNPSFS